MGDSYNEALDGATILDPVIIGGTIDDTPIGQTTPVDGDFKPLTAIAPDATTSFTGTISAASRTATFTSTTDYNLCKVGSTLIAAGNTRIVMALLGSDQVTVDVTTTWGAATAITSLQDPISQHKDSAGNVDMYVNALGGVGLIGGLGMQKGIAFGDGDTGFYEESDDSITVSIEGTKTVVFNSSGITAFASNYARAALLATIAQNNVPNIVPLSAYPNTGIGRAATDQLSLIAGGVEGIRIAEFGSKPYTIIGGTQIANLTTCTFPTANKNQISKTAVGTNLAVGDLVLITAGTGATLDAYRATVIDSSALITVDRNIHAEASDITDGSVSTIKDGLLISPTDGTNGQRIMGYSHQNKPLQIGGDTLLAPTYVANAGLGVDVQIGKHLILPFENDAATPTLAFGDGDTGFYESVDDNIDIAIEGAAVYRANTSYFGSNTSRSRLLNISATSTAPNIIPTGGDENTGIGRAAADQLSLIAGGVEALRLIEDTTIELRIAKNDSWLSGLNYATSAAVNMLKVNVDDEIDVGGTLVLGAPIEAAEDSGAVVAFDMPVSATPAALTEESFTHKIDGNNVLTVGAFADSAGGVTGEFVKNHGAQMMHKTDAGAANYAPSILTSDYIITTDTTAAARAVTISTEDRDSGSAAKPRIFIIKDVAGNAGANNITISLETAGTIDGAATAVINANYNSLTIAIDGTNGYII